MGDALQALQMEQLQETMETNAADARESIATFQEQLGSMSAELAKSVQRSQQHASKLQLIKQVQVQYTLQLRLLRGRNLCITLHVPCQHFANHTSACGFICPVYMTLVS